MPTIQDDEVRLKFWLTVHGHEHKHRPDIPEEWSYQWWASVAAALCSAAGCFPADLRSLGDALAADQPSETQQTFLPDLGGGT